MALDRSGIVLALGNNNNSHWWDLDQGTRRAAGDVKMWDEFVGEDTLILDNKQLVLSMGLRSLETPTGGSEEVATWIPLGKITAYTAD